MATVAPQRMTVAEFLEWDDGTDTRYELVAGRIVAMVPPAEDHGTIVINLARQIGNHLTAPCRVLDQAGIALPGRDDAYYQAGLAVTCAPPERGRDRRFCSSTCRARYWTTRREFGDKVLQDFMHVFSGDDLALIRATLPPAMRVYR